MLIRTQNSIYDLTKEVITVHNPNHAAKEQEFYLMQYKLTKIGSLPGKPATVKDHQTFIGNTVSINPDGCMYLWMGSSLIIRTSELDI